METNRIRQFRAIVEAGNLRKASQLLSISHSGLSKSMKALEEELGFKLFLPSGRGLAVTDRGREVYNRSAGFLKEVERLSQSLSLHENAPLRIGSFEVFTSQFLGTFLARESLAAEIHELVPGRLEEALLAGRVDVGITYEPIAREGLYYVRIKTIPMAPFVVKGAFATRALLDIPFIIPVRPIDGLASGVKGLDGWPEAKFKRATPYGVDLLSTGLELVRQGLGAIFIPEFVARLHNDLAKPDLQLEMLPLPRGMKSVRRDVFLMRREATEEDRNFQRLAQALRRL